jgi:hypothetical protein
LPNPKAMLSHGDKAARFREAVLFHNLRALFSLAQFSSSRWYS